ncbi:hypothetical protein TCAL_01948 [Tigriopus californicus]|uniref:Rho-GAP domain-containing protein n=1 Tax=Tigriopus californicus TaxID=6832 RepID=A0A553P7Y1_TIGCA|nr:mucin-2-like [Tigriopus californicus]TRY73792.1 hypothetical protein TCAL_01948 [Tigriopus californicus]
MSSWGERMASVVSACGPRLSATHPGIPYHRRLEKVKFGVPLEQVCKKDIPGPLLVMLLKLNKEGPCKKDVFRAPGHQGSMRKLIHFLQQGRLVNIHSFSVNTIASVLKKFLRKIPGGIFGPENEAELFSIVKLESKEEKLAQVQRVFLSLPIYSQHLLVLLFGTFRVIHSNSEQAQTGMTAEALGVSVAPSFFQTCVLTGKHAKMEDVERFKLATKVTTFFIEHFGVRDLYGRENYEYYAKLTGRILRVEDELIFFTYPSIAFGPGTRDDMDASLDCIGASDDIRHQPAALEKTGSLEIIPENCTLDPQGRLSISLDDQNVSSPSSCGSPSVLGGIPEASSSSGFRSHTLGRPSLRYNQTPTSALQQSQQSETLPRRPGRGLDSRSHITQCLPQVHEIQTERMKHRSEWFLSDASGLVTVKCGLRSHPLGSSRPSTLLPVVSTSARAAAGRELTSKESATPLPPIDSSLILAHSPAPSSNAPSGICDTSKLLSSITPIVPHSSQVSKVLTAAPTTSSPSVSLNIQGILATPSSAPPIQSTPLSQATVGLRRGLSDKDKERRLVRRSSSKKKDKENGGSAVGGGACATSISGSSGNIGTPEKQVGSSLALHSSSESSGTPSSTTGSGHHIVIGYESSVSGRPPLKRTGSVDGQAGSSSPSLGAHHHHAMLCRTGSQDTPHQAPPSTPPSSVAATQPLRSTTGSESPLTRSLPRI